MMNTKASRNKLILKLAKKKSTNMIQSSIRGQSTWELIHAENGI